jgi:hypothetical protein
LFHPSQWRIRGINIIVTATKKEHNEGDGRALSKARWSFILPIV